MNSGHCHCVCCGPDPGTLIEGGGGGGCSGDGAGHGSHRPEPSREAVRPAAPPRGVGPRALPARAPAGWPSGPAGSFERGEVVGGWQGRARGSMPARRGAPASQCEMKPLEPPPSRRLDSRDALDTPLPPSSGAAGMDMSLMGFHWDVEDDVAEQGRDQWPPVDVGLYLVGPGREELLSPELPLEHKRSRRTSAHASTTKRCPTSGMQGVCGRMAARAG